MVLIHTYVAANKAPFIREFECPHPSSSSLFIPSSAKTIFSMPYVAMFQFRFIRFAGTTGITGTAFQAIPELPNRVHPYLHQQN